MNIREITEQNEALTLSPFASLSKNTKGRDIPLAPCQVRTAYQRDRDRIIHSKSFRRLQHKTQVFITPQGDHYRTRLTHTLEVSQIARTLARGLRLNEDLTEAMALGHDLGHTPFGHTGEAALNAICPDGFRHNEQSLRVVEKLEGGGGLNLTQEVREGILKHTGEDIPETLEGRIIRFADRIAYINHDIDDAIRGGILDAGDLPADCTDVLGKTHGERINTMICDIIANSQGKNDVVMSSECQTYMDKLRAFMFERVYYNSEAKREDHKVLDIISILYEKFTKKPQLLPSDAGIDLETGDISRLVCDYIAGMSDRYAVYIFNDLCVPKSWQKL